MRDKPLHFIPREAKSGKQALYWSPAPVTGCDGQACTVDLPAIKGQPGCFKLTCEDCPAWGLVAMRASVDDPRTFTLPCGRLKMHE